MAQYLSFIKKMKIRDLKAFEVISIIDDPNHKDRIAFESAVVRFFEFYKKSCKKELCKIFPNDYGEVQAKFAQLITSKVCCEKDIRFINLCLKYGNNDNCGIFRNPPDDFYSNSKYFIDRYLLG